MGRRCLLLGPHSLPRTLQGVGGARLIDMPGVRYPEAMLHARRGSDENSGKAYALPPAWGMSSRQAADALGLSVRTARALLNRHKARYRLVFQQGRPACLYWEKSVVKRLLASRMPLVRKIPAKLCSAAEACCILMVARSTLFRYVKQGVLQEYKIRYATKSGVRLLSHYLRADVRRLAARRNAVRVRASSLQMERLKKVWNGRMSSSYIPKS